MCADFANPRATLEAARAVFNTQDGATAPALWSEAQRVLQQVLGRPELTGQALISELRRLGRITLSDAHALVALNGWADRSTAAAANESERLIVREAWMALDHAVPDESPFAPPKAPASPLSPPPQPPPFPRSSPRPSSAAPEAFATGVDSGGDAVMRDGSPHRRRLYLGLAAVALLVVVVAGGVWWYAAGRGDRQLEAGIDAYQRGSRETARVAFADAAEDNPDDARPLIYLGRISREDGDLARARRFLTNAVRLAPSSSVATRELASVMLADGQPEIARRFYVRAIELDPNDRTAQGFLGCALIRLQRFDEARRWSERAGPGDWQRCASSIPMPMPGAPMAPSGYAPAPPR